MSYRDKIDNFLKNPETRLLGQIDITDNEYKELISYTRNRVLYLQFQTIAPADIYLSVALVQIAIRKYSDGNYWDYFKSEIDPNLPSSRTNLVGQVFAATLRKYHLFQIDREAGAKYAYVENIKAHAFVPTNYLHGYFDFLFAFYDRNLLRQLPEDISEDFSEMSEFFSSTLRETSDSFVLRNLDNKPAKSYKLLKATRTLFAQGDPTVLSKEIYSHLKIIDDYYYDGLLKARDNRFAAGFSEWIKATSEQIENNKKGNRRRSDVFYRKPYFYVDRRTGISYLIIPELKIRNEDYEGVAYVDITAESLHRKEQLSLYRAFGILVSEPIKIPVTNLFEEYQIIISSKNERLFTIPRENYRIFDEEFYETPKLRNGQNYLLVKKATVVRGEKPVYVNEVYPDWSEYSFDDIDDKSVIYIDNIPVSTTGSFVVGADYAFVSREYELYDFDRRVQTAYKHPTISFTVSKDALDGCFIVVRDKRMSVKDNAASIVELPGENDRCGVTMILEDLVFDHDGLYRIILDEPRKAHKELCKYVLLRSLRCHTEKRRYIFADEALITVSGDYDIKPINCKEVGDGYNYILSLDENVECADFSLWIDEHDYTVKVPVLVFKHGFEGNLRSSRPEYLWHTELKNDLFISMPGATEATAYIASKDIRINAQGTSLGNGVFRFDLSAIAQAIRTNDHPYNYISIKYTDNTCRTLSLYRVLNRIFVSKADVFFDEENRVVVNVDYEGKNDLVLRFCENNTETVVVERTVTNGINAFPELSGDGLYTMHMLEVTPDPFGFASTEREIGYPKRGIGAIDLEDISNCKIMLVGASQSGVRLKFDYSYGLFNLKRIDEYTYRGTLTEQKRQSQSGTRYKVNTVAENALIECIPDQGKLVVISIQTEYEEDVFDPVYYDKKLRKYVCSDGVLDNDYTRYIAMYDDEAVFETEVRRIK